MPPALRYDRREQRGEPSRLSGTNIAGSPAKSGKTISEVGSANEHSVLTGTGGMP
ncbi:hypothetical protein NDU88_006382, partial [Pleurodeles waltl]